MKKTIAIILSGCLLLFAFACSDGKKDEMTNTQDNTEFSSGTEISSGILTPEEPRFEAPDSFNVLAIGNSFTIDTFEYLYQIAESYGTENIYLANAAISGAGLAKHVECIRGDLANYDYYLFNGITTATGGHTLKSCISERNWDRIVLIGNSGQVGIERQYSVLQEVLDYINENKTNPEAKLGWLFSWAYQNGSDHPSFALYDNDQLKMYNMGAICTKNCVGSNPDISVIVPLATAFQNIRTSRIGDTLTRDGYHADLTVGRYALALTFFCSVTGADPHACTYRLDTDVTADGDVFDIIAEAVENAVSEPYSITQSSYQ